MGEVSAHLIGLFLSILKNKSQFGVNNGRWFQMEADLERILVDSIQLETENITLKQLVRFYNGKPDMQDQLKNMLHYNKQVRRYLYIFYYIILLDLAENNRFI